MKVLYLSYDGLTDPLGQSQVLPYIIGLGAKGFEFIIISFEKAQNYQKEKERIEMALAVKKREIEERIAIEKETASTLSGFLFSSSSC